jgi:hypothetical protein
MQEHTFAASRARPVGLDRELISSVAHLEDVAGLDDDVVHVHEPEPGEVPGHGDEVHGGALVEQQQARVVHVALPPELPQPPLKHLVRGHHLAAGDVDQHLAPPAATAAGRRPFVVLAGVLHAADEAVLEHPHAGHVS